MTPAVAVLALIPVLLVLVLIYLYGVDAPYLDQWSMVEDIEKYLSGTWGLHDLLRSHNGHRMMLARLILVPLAALSGWNTRIEMAVGVAFAFGILIVFARALTDRSTRRVLPGSQWFVPIASVAVFSLNQWENWLWGIQSFEFMTVFWIAAGLWILSAPTISSSRLAASVACGIAATFCKAAGLVFWPAGLAVLVVRPRSARTGLVRWICGWAGATIAVAVVFSMRLPGDALGPALSFSSVANHPVAFAYFALTVLGAPVVSFLGSAWPPRDLGFGFAAGIIGLSVLSWLAAQRIRRGQWPQRAEIFLFAMSFYSVGVATQIGIARFTFGGPQAMASRYITHAMPFWIALAALIAFSSLRRQSPEKGGMLAPGGAVAGIAVIVLLLIAGSILAVPEFRSRFEALAPARAALETGQDPVLLARLHPELRQVYGNLGVLQYRRLSVFRDLPPLQAPPVRLQPLQNFGQILVARRPIPTLVAGGEIALPVRITNPTCETWPHIADASGSFAVHLSYRWQTPGGDIVVRNGLRTPLPADLAPGASAEVDVRIKTPDEPGSYLLKLSMVQESVDWFFSRQAPPLSIRFEVDSPGKP